MPHDAHIATGRNGTGLGFLEASASNAQEALVLFSQHERQDARCLCGITGIFGAKRERWIVIVDLPEELVAIELECPEIMLAIGIGAFVEVVISPQLLDKLTNEDRT